MIRILAEAIQTGGVDWQGVGVVVSLLMGGGIGGVIATDKIKSKKNGKSSATDGGCVTVRECDTRHRAMDKRFDDLRDDMKNGFERLQHAIEGLRQ